MTVGDAGRITVSAGVAELQADEDAAAALARADASLYRAKAAGRNRVECDDPRLYGEKPWFRPNE
jgi:PleD family two-component response regulator